MDDFCISQIGEGVYCLLDKDEDSFYLIDGEREAAVIDTGISPGKRILPMLMTLTDKPMSLVLTHAHIDHVHHMDEFERVYLCHDELTLPQEWLRSHMAGKELDFAGTIHMDTGSTIDLGGCVLEICKVPGHTPGSVAVYDRRDDLLFTGDAIGSGAGVWMQLVGSTSMEEYEQSLVSFMKWLLDRGGRMAFWGGHCRQYATSKQVPGNNPLSMGLLADLIDLTRGLLAGRITGEPVDLPEHLRAGEARYAAWGRAEMLYNPDNIHK